ncbi:Kdo domain containing protein [Tamlana sedimentorum]|uniref:Kdo domain containing protein n=1 Tax=Neotamlana sedimentorum TaxID=1435349 RepID=A0A0D7W749_9FLAO|nr:lipopolysaccharide kinase InaA family protein [Tamlana sedimentorum]KJD34940.1 Kdo domain containing protein [Tamlana sedimentorum]
MKNVRIDSNYKINEAALNEFVEKFDARGEKFTNQNRNKLKIFDLNDFKVVIKSFKIPNLVNQLAYSFFRKSKARRSFEYAKKLLALGIKTPEPIGYFEYKQFGLFKKSYYLSKHFNYDFTIRALVDDDNYPNYDQILRAFTRFTFKLHENKINFLDHSPGNTLIKKTETGYEFYLVDLNRMNFEEMDFDARMNNFARLSPRGKMLSVMSSEYATLLDDKTEAQVKERMLYFSKQFSHKFKARERFKKKYFFWRKKRK